MSATKYLDDSGMSYFWGKLKTYFSKGNGRIYYGTCSTAAGTAAKEVSCSAFTSADLEAGTLLLVTFSAANTATASNLTLSVNGTTALSIKNVQGASLQSLSEAGQIRATTHLFILGQQPSNKYWVLANTDEDTTPAIITTSEINTGTGTGKRSVSASVLRSNFYTETEVDALIAGIGGTPVATSQPAGGMLPNVLYKLGTLSGSVTLSLAAATDNTIENEYHFTFDTGSTAPTITWPSNLTWSGGSAPTINASKHYEVSIEDGYAYATEF